MPVVDSTGPFRTPGVDPHWTDHESFLHRHFRPPSPLGIILIVLVGGVVAGFLTAVVWAMNDNEQVRGAPAPPTTVAAADDDEPVVSTTTTRPDLSMEGIDEKLRPLLWSVSTLDAAGQPSVGSAFSAGTTEGRTLLLTSLAVVEAGTRAPGPEIRVQNGSYSGPATLWTWEEGRDLALLVVPKGSLPAIPWANENPPPRAGDRLFLVAADRVSPGVVTGVSGEAIQHNIFVDDPLRGGALVNIKGEVLAVASGAYSGGGQPTDTAFFSPPLRKACAQVLVCPGVTPAASPTTGGTTTTSAGRTTTTGRR